MPEKALIAGVMRQGDNMILGFSSKSYKTFTLLDLGLSVAHGIPWIGFDTAKGRGLFINFDGCVVVWTGARLIGVRFRLENRESKPQVRSKWFLPRQDQPARDLIYPHPYC